MKKTIALLLCLTVVIALAGCGSGTNQTRKTGKQPAGVQDVMNAATTKKNAANQSGSGAKSNGGLSGGKKKTGPAKVDVDLTSLSSTMVYSEVYSMMTEPKNYLGKTVKMSGKFAVYHDDATGKDYYACIVADATACCSQGLEFILTSDYSYPNDYPEKGTEICVAGTFDTYREGGNTYCTLRNASLV